MKECEWDIWEKINSDLSEEELEKIKREWIKNETQSKQRNKEDILEKIQRK